MDILDVVVTCCMKEDSLDVIENLGVTTNHLFRLI